jgi:hypothetical protein
VAGGLTAESAAEIPEWEIEELIRMAIVQGLRDDIADRAIAWLDERVDAYKRLRGTLQ